jgi:hypothetical protein
MRVFPRTFWERRIYGRSPAEFHEARQQGLSAVEFYNSRKIQSDVRRKLGAN